MSTVDNMFEEAIGSSTSNTSSVITFDKLYDYYTKINEFKCGEFAVSTLIDLWNFICTNLLLTEMYCIISEDLVTYQAKLELLGHYMEIVKLTSAYRHKINDANIVNSTCDDLCKLLDEITEPKYIWTTKESYAPKITLNANDIVSMYLRYDDSCENKTLCAYLFKILFKGFLYDTDIAYKELQSIDIKSTDAFDKISNILLNIDSYISDEAVRYKNKSIIVDDTRWRAIYNYITGEPLTDDQTCIINRLGREMYVMEFV